MVSYVQVQSTYMNPENKELDEDGYFSDDLILNRVPSVFLLLGSIYGIIQVTKGGAFIIKLILSLKLKIFSYLGYGHFFNLGPSLRRREFHDGTSHR